MSRNILILALSMALAACATSAAPPPAAGEVAAPVSPSPGPAAWAVSIVGTPFALVFKTAFCAASLVVAAPIAGLLVLDPDPSSEAGQQILGDGIANNCGPPWVVSPYAAS